MASTVWDPTASGWRTSRSSRPGRALAPSPSSPTPTAASASAGRSVATRRSSSCSRRSTWRSGCAADARRRRDPPLRTRLPVHLVRVHPPTRHAGPSREHGHRWRRARQRDVREPDRNDEDREAQQVALAHGRGVRAAVFEWIRGSSTSPLGIRSFEEGKSHRRQPLDAI
jgi:hypothetical protein